ncbi:hypothetical protein ACVDG5_029875 [Mesorhizobium sp. ORM6]
MDGELVIVDAFVAGPGQDRQFDRTVGLGHLLLVIDVQPQFLVVEPVPGEVGILEQRPAQLIADRPCLDFEVTAKVEGRATHAGGDAGIDLEFHRSVIDGAPESAGGNVVPADRNSAITRMIVRIFACPQSPSHWR